MLSKVNQSIVDLFQLIKLIHNAYRRKKKMIVIERHFQVRFVRAGLMGRLIAGLIDEFEMIQVWKPGCLADGIRVNCRFLVESKLQTCPHGF